MTETVQYNTKCMQKTMTSSPFSYIDCQVEAKVTMGTYIQYIGKCIAR